MPVSYQVEPFELITPELAKLYPEHYKEVAESKEEIPLAPDYDQYNAMAKAGQLIVVTVRDGEKLIGYFKVAVKPHLHYRNSLTAYTDIYYLMPEYRAGRIGYNMFRYVIDEMKRRKVERFYIGYKIKKPYKRLFEKLGFTEIEHHYSMYLG